MQISDLTAKGVNVAGLKAVVSKMDTKTAGNGKEYIAGTLMDLSGVIGFKVWDNIPLMSKLLETGNAVEVKAGVTDEYQGTVSVKLASVTQLPQEQAKELVQCAPIPYEELEAKIIQAFTDMGIAEAVDRLKTLGVWDTYMLIPAARMHHHAYLHGLLQHTLEVYEWAMMTADMQATYHGLQLDKQVIGIAALFHDIGKIREYDVSPLGLLTGFNRHGELLGHHYMSAKIATKVLSKLVTAEQIEEIEHCILSHHGRLEWGAAIVPKTPYAMIVHLADMASSQPVSAKDEPTPLY